MGRAVGQEGRASIPLVAVTHVGRRIAVSKMVGTAAGGEVAGVSDHADNNRADCQPVRDPVAVLLPTVLPPDSHVTRRRVFTAIHEWPAAVGIAGINSRPKAIRRVVAIEA